jgi:branched-chain amino acid transport system ATP-binding protein
MTMSALLETHALSAFYGDFQALFGIDVTVASGEVIALIGSNGAGKSTFLKSVAGLRRGGEHRRQGHCAGAGRAASVRELDGRRKPAARCVLQTAGALESPKRL